MSSDKEVHPNGIVGFVYDRTHERVTIDIKITDQKQESDWEPVAPEAFAPVLYLLNEININSLTSRCISLVSGFYINSPDIE